MDITVSITNFRSLSQSELIMRNLFATVQIGSVTHSGRGVLLQDGKFRSGTVENPLVLTLKNSQTETVMYVRNIPISTVLARGGLFEQWVAVYPPGDPQNLHFDASAAPKDGCPQVCLSVAIEEDLISTGAPQQRATVGYGFSPPPRGSMDPDAADPLRRTVGSLQGDLLADAGLRNSVMGGSPGSVDSSVRETERQALRIKEHVAEMANAQRRAQDVSRTLQDNLRILEDMKRQLKSLEMQIAEQRVAAQLLDRDREQLCADEAQIQDQIRQRDATFQELRGSRDEIDRELTRVLSEGERQKNAIEASSRDFARQTQSILADIDQSKRQVAQLAESLRNKELMLTQSEQKANQEEHRLAQEGAERQVLRVQLEQTRLAMVGARGTLEETQRRHQSAELDYQEVKARLAGFEAEVEGLNEVVQAKVGSVPKSLAVDAKANLQLTREKLEAYTTKVRTLEAELAGNRDQLEKLSTHIAELHSEAREKEMATKRFEEERVELQRKLEVQQRDCAEALRKREANERLFAEAERELRDAVGGEVELLERRRAELLEAHRTEEQLHLEAMVRQGRDLEEARGQLERRGAELAQLKDEEIRQRTLHIQGLETECEGLTQQVSRLDAERRELQERLIERDRARQSVGSESQRAAQECEALEASLREATSRAQALEQREAELGRALASASQRGAALRAEADGMAQQIQAACAAMEESGGVAGREVAAATEKVEALRAQCSAKEQEVQALRASCSRLQEEVAAAAAARRTADGREEEVREALARVRSELNEARADRSRQGAASADLAAQVEDLRFQQEAQAKKSADAMLVKQNVQEFENSLQQLSTRLVEAQEAVRRRRAEEEELRTDIQKLKESIRITSDKLVYQVEHSNLQFETIQNLEDQKARFEGEVEVLTLGLHDSEQRNQHLLQENKLMQQQVEGLYPGSLQDWAAEVHRVKVAAEVVRYKEEIDLWKQKAEQLRKEKQVELTALQRQHEETVSSLRARIAAVQVEIEHCEQSAKRREVAFAKQRVHGEPAAPTTAMPGLVVPQRPLQSGHQRRKALLVGINYTTSHAPLKGCVNDLWNLQCLLRHTLQYADDQLRLLFDSVDGKPQRLDRMPTKANIQAGLQWLINGAQPGDNLVFIFCGYGAQHPSAPGSDQYEGYLVPVDFAADLPEDFFHGLDDGLSVQGSTRPPPPGAAYRLVPLLELSDAICRLPPMCRMSVMMDCCYAAVPCAHPVQGPPPTFPKVKRGQVNYSRLRDFISRPRFLELPELPVRHTPAHLQPNGFAKCWLHCFSGSKLEEWSAEFPIEGTVQGAFSWAWLKALARGHFHCGLYQFQGMLAEMLSDLKIHFRGVEQTPVLQLSQTASMQDVVLWT